MRDDIRGVDRCPADVAEYLETIGGKTPFGEPMWRLVLAHTVVWKVRGGKIWDDSLTVAERGGIDIETGRQHTNKPLRDESDKLTEQRRYSYLEGWILQKWFPASSYSKSEWFAPDRCFPDGTPHLGPYPYCGDYEMQGCAVEQMPSKEALRGFIGSYYQALEKRSPNIETRMRERQNTLEYEERERNRQALAHVDAVRRDRCSYITSGSLAAGRIRTERAEKLGIRTHMGN